MAIPIRGLQEIKTLSAVVSSGDGLNERHVLQFRLGALELECTRRRRERHAAFKRIKDIDARLAEIDALIHKCRETLDGTGVDAAAKRGASNRAVETAGKRRHVLRYGA